MGRRSETYFDYEEFEGEESGQNEDQPLIVATDTVY
jgi:hypothetical protein